MKKAFLLFGAAVVAAAIAQPAAARDRYAERPPVVVSPDLSAPWVMQLKSKPGKRLTRADPARRAVAPEARSRTVLENIFGGSTRTTTARTVRRHAPDGFQTAGIAAPAKRQIKPQFDPKYLPQTVDYTTAEAPGTIVIDTVQNYLYLIQ